MRDTRAAAVMVCLPPMASPVALMAVSVVGVTLITVRGSLASPRCVSPAALAQVLVVAAVALGIALRDAGAPRWAPVLFGIAGLLISAHPPPFGPTGLVLFAIGTVLIMRENDLVKEPVTRARA